jgi:hypothetical protein
MQKRLNAANNNLSNKYVEAPEGVK